MTKKLINLLMVLRLMLLFELCIYSILEIKQYISLLIFNQGIVSENDIKLFVLNIFFNFAFLIPILFSKNTTINVKKCFSTFSLAIIFITVIRIMSILFSNYIGQWKMKTDGSQKQRVCSDLVYYSIAVSNNWIYYSNYSDNGKLYKIKTDGTHKQKVK